MKCLWVLFITLFVAFLSGGTKAYAADEIKIGVIGPMKFVYGDHMMIGAQMAVEKINAAGGIKVKGKNYKIVLHKSDDNSFLSTPDAVSAMERLVTMTKVDFVIGGFRTEAVLAQQEVMADNKIIFLGLGSAHDEQCLKVARNYDRYKYWFRVSCQGNITGIKNLVVLADPVIRALKKIGIEKPRIALLMDKAQWADPLAVDAKKLFPQMGCEVVGEWRPGFSATSVAAELSAIKSSGAHMIFLAAAGPAGNVINRQWGELKIPAAIEGSNTEGGRSGHWQTTNGLCNYAAVPNAFGDVEITPYTRPFYAEFTKRTGGEYPIYTGAGAYDAINLLKTAIERAGTLDSDEVVVALEKTDHVGIVGTIAFTPRGDVTPHTNIWGPKHATWILEQWIDGKKYVVWPDGREIHPALIAAGAPAGWDKVKYKGSREYVLPPWVVDYWKGKK